MRTQQIPAKTCTEAVLRQAFKGTQWCSFATNERPLKGCFRKITNDRRRPDRLIFLGAVPAISCVLGYYRFRLYGESLSLCLRERESNLRESAPGIRVSLRETSLTPALFRGSSRWAILGPSCLIWHPCQMPLSTAPPFGLLTGPGIEAFVDFVGAALAAKFLTAEAGAHLCRERLCSS